MGAVAVEVFSLAGRGAPGREAQGVKRYHAVAERGVAFVLVAGVEAGVANADGLPFALESGVGDPDGLVDFHDLAGGVVVDGGFDVLVDVLHGVNHG